MMVKEGNEFCGEHAPIKVGEGPMETSEVSICVNKRAKKEPPLLASFWLTFTLPPLHRQTGTSSP